MKLTTSRRQSIRSIEWNSLALLMILTCSGCGSSNSPPPPPPPPPPAISVTITPVRGSLAVSQNLTFTANVKNDVGTQGVTWSVTGGGIFNSSSSTSTTYTAPAATAGVVTITAKSVADGSKQASATIGVTDLQGVTTYLNGNSRQGANIQEYALATSGPTAVHSTNLGKLFSCNVDGAIYAEPLWVANLLVSGNVHNVVFVATQHDTVYAFDADANANPCVPLWTASLIDANHGGVSGETWVSSSDESGCGDVAPDIGIVGTPVINLGSKTMYVVSKSKNSAAIPFNQKLHALDITTGMEKPSPVVISATASGNGNGSVGGVLTFDPLLNNQRSALLLENGHVIIAWASHCDFGAYHGWVMSYNAATLAQEAVLNATPNGARAGVWMAGAGPAADASGNIYLATGNGTFDANSGTSPNNDYGDSVLKLGLPSGGKFPVSSYFTPKSQAALEANDGDQGSGGVLLLPAVGAHNYLVQAGKEGNVYVADDASLGGYSTTSNNVVQELAGVLPGGVWGAPTYWNGNVYYGAAQDPLASSDPLRAFSFDTVTAATLSASPTSVTTKIYGFPGPTSPVSSNGNANGIAWALDNSMYCTAQSLGCGPTVLHAYDATNLAHELWNSSQSAADQAGFAVKFTVPTVANGRVYVGTRGTDTGLGSASPGELDVYGLKPN
jgi:hypothetical protein